MISYSLYVFQFTLIVVMDAFPKRSRVICVDRYKNISRSTKTKRVVHAMRTQFISIQLQRLLYITKQKIFIYKHRKMSNGLLAFVQAYLLKILNKKKTYD